MSVQSVTGGSCCHRFYNNVIHPLCEKIKKFVSSIWDFIKKTFSKIFCIKKKTVSLENTNFEIDQESLKIRFSNPCLKILKECIKKGKPFHVYSAENFEKIDLVKKLKYNKFKKNYYAPKDFYFYNLIMNRLESGKFTNNSKNYKKNRKHFLPKDLLNLIQNFEKDIKDKKYPHKEFSHAAYHVLGLLRFKKNTPKEDIFSLNKKDNNTILTTLFNQYRVETIQNIFCRFRLDGFKKYLMHLSKNLAIINEAQQFVKFKEGTTNENYLNLKNSITTKFPDHYKHIAIFFGSITVARPDLSTCHSNLIEVDRENKKIHYYNSWGDSFKNAPLIIEFAQRLPSSYFKDKKPHTPSIKLTVSEFIKFVKEVFEKKDGKKYELIENKTKYQFDSFNCEYFSVYELTKKVEKLTNKKILPSLKGSLKNNFASPENREFMEVFKKETITKNVFSNPVVISKIHNVLVEILEKNHFIENYPSLKNI